MKIHRSPAFSAISISYDLEVVAEGCHLSGRYRDKNERLEWKGSYPDLVEELQSMMDLVVSLPFEPDLTQSYTCGGELQIWDKSGHWRFRCIANIADEDVRCRVKAVVDDLDDLIIEVLREKSPN